MAAKFDRHIFIAKNAERMPGKNARFYFTSSTSGILKVLFQKASSGA